MGQGLHQVDRAGGKVPACATQQNQGAQNLIRTYQRNDEDGVETGRNGELLERIARSARKIRNPHRLLFLARQPQYAFVHSYPAGANRILVRLVECVRFREIEDASRCIVAVDGAGVGLRELDSTRHDRGEHGLVVQRGRDGAPDLLERFQLADRLCKIARAFGDFLLQPSVGPLQLVCHAVEMVGEIRDLILRLHFDAMAEIARLQLLGTDLQGANRNDHFSRQEHAGQHGQEHAQRQQPRGAEQQIVDRLKRLAQRLLEEHVPLHSRHRGRGGQDRASIRVLPEDHGFGVRPDRGGDLRKIRKIGAKPGGGGRVSEQPPGRAYDKSLVVGADLLRSYETRQEFEIDLGNG